MEGGSSCSITDACRGSRSQARTLRPRLPTGAGQMTDPDGAQARGTRLCKEGGHPLWMQMSSGLQCAVYPSRCLHGAFPEEVGSFSGEIGSCPPKAVIVKVHGGGAWTDQSPSPHGHGQNSQPSVFFAMWVVRQLLVGGLSCPPQPSHPPALRAWAWPGVCSMVLLNPVS